MSRYVSGISTVTSLTALRVLLGLGVMAVFVLLNWLGAQLFARVNGALTVAKFVMPTLTVVLGGPAHSGRAVRTDGA